MAIRFSVVGGRGRSFAKRIENMKTRMVNPFNDPALAAQTVTRLRRGVGLQFTRETYMNGAASIPWPKTKPFGNRKLGKTLAGPKLRRAWTGKSGHSVQSVTGKTVSIGVRGLREAEVFQRNTAAVVYPKKFADPRKPLRLRGKKKGQRIAVRGKAAKAEAERRARVPQYAMRFLLGMKYDVWISNARLRQGLVIEPRRVGVSLKTNRGIARDLRNYFLGIKLEPVEGEAA